ncbi:hypothetical protein W97_04025 [Coniosporium apollinis CBS 100218]|uniref:DUF7580 domain-containing protein n=1 Tax=Coniosporium apollinis (strain CBS 100218) TaxID=1168221 RepID=R7YS85_CONA1|nr:uncharacterized protein W97_04025 [Coniosporium apollinis CBS 100218]EON64792.1 hypothetical protein W97_04025 [Coniosporium apollinis CBS 100218]
MSGLEIVGVVLGSFPLVVAALEHYSKGISTVKQIFRYKYVFDDIHISLVGSVTIFRQSCEQLLRGLMLPETQLRDLIDMRQGWDDPALDEKLRRRLGNRDHKIYGLSVKQLGKKIDQLKEKLELRDDLSVGNVPAAKQTSADIFPKAQFVRDGVIDDRLCKEFFNPWRCFTGGFSARQCTLALTLATAVLTLCNTSWLRESWCFGDIYFVEENQRVSLANQPYVSANFVLAPTSQQTVQTASRPVLLQVKNQMIFSLGAALLEISYGKPLSFFKEDLDDCSNEHIIMEYSIASRLLDRMSDRESWKYTKAVKYCIHPTPTDPPCSFSLDNEMFRSIFYREVVLPLHENYLMLG